MKHLLTLLAILGASRADAATIRWNSVQNTTGVADVVTAGTIRTARNINGSGTQTVNGVPFTAFLPSGWGQGAVTAGLAGSDTGNAAYNAILNTSVASSGGSPANPSLVGAIRLDSLAPGGFTSGRMYLIQVWYTDQRTNVAGLNDRVVRLNSCDQTITITTGNTDAAQIPTIDGGGTVTVGTSSGGLEADPDNIAGAGDTAFGSFVTGTWIADGSPMYLLVQGFPLPGFTMRPAISAFQIRDVTPVIEAHALDAGTRESTITFTTQPGYAYTLEGSADLLAWVPLVSGISGTGSGVTLTHTPPGAPAAYFYRAKAVP